MRGKWYADGYGEGVAAAEVGLTDEREDLRRLHREDRVGEASGMVREHGAQMAGDLSYDVDRPGGPTSEQFDRWEEGFHAGYAARIGREFARPRRRRGTRLRRARRRR